jgi:hypothetical protein
LCCAVDLPQCRLRGELEGFVIDLRNNSRGLVDQAIAVSSAVLDQGEIVSMPSRNAEDTQRFNARRGDLTVGKPLIVLLNVGTASASEIVAGALQDHKQATLVGTRIFGKSLVQTIISLGPEQGRTAVDHGARRQAVRPKLKASNQICRCSRTSPLIWQLLMPKARPRCAATSRRKTSRNRARSPMFRRMKRSTARPQGSGGLLRGAITDVAFPPNSKASIP